MRFSSRWGWMVLCFGFGGLVTFAHAAMEDIAIVWAKAPAGELTVDRGQLKGLRADGGAAADARTFTFAGDRPGRLVASIDGVRSDDETGTLIRVTSKAATFTFRLRDVDRDYPVYLPVYGVAITTGGDTRTYAQIAADVSARKLRTKRETIESQPEETFAGAAANVRQMKIETWLGLSRDERVFRVDDRMQWIKPRFHWREEKLPETSDKPVIYDFFFGRGYGPRDDITRRLEDGVLPILHGHIGDEAITYDVTTFVSLEQSPLTAETLRGTPYLVADFNGAGHMFTPAQQAELDKLKPGEANRSEETVLYIRSVAKNTGATPQFAFFRTMSPRDVKRTEWHYDRATGFSVFKSGRVFAVTKLNGRIAANEEYSILLNPGETAVLEMYVPHLPIPAERAAALSRQSFDQRHAEARTFWEKKLAVAGRWHLPEQRMDEMLRAGLLHLDLITYGLEPKGTLIPTIGDYTAIGSESSPIIQFMDSMGWHDTAARAINFFLDKQHDDGFIQNFNGYMLETGATLWTMGEHYRYTHDDAWLRDVKPRMLKACNYIKAWRARNQNGAKGDGYGMLDGKTADPDDPFRSFMLNGYAYLGLSRVAEMLAASDPAEAKVWRDEAQALKHDIRESFFKGVERSPVIPLSDGTWIPSSAPWTGYRGLVMLHADGGSWFTHGTITGRDAMLGPLYLVFQEVIDPTEPVAGWLVETTTDLMTDRNAVFSQPYYSRHPYIYLRRGEAKPFIKAWYNTVAALADRDTYTFYEHFFGVSSHKTHEEAWFLMETRWMLYFEAGNTLHLLAGVPRAYLEDGKTIELNKAATYFGPMSFKVESHAAANRIDAAITADSPRHPDNIELRVPHPRGRKAVSVEGGMYDAGTETVRIEHFTGSAKVVLRY